jgi:hypothetical protein
LNRVTAERGVYDTIINLIYAAGTDEIALTEKALAIRCACHWRELRRLLDELVKRGKIVILRQSCAGSAAVLRVSCAAKKCANELQKARKRVARASHNATKRWKNNDLSDATASNDSNARARTTHQPTTINQQESPHNPPEGDGDAEEVLRTRQLNAEFAEWWTKYPHKVGKDAARRKFETVRKRGVGLETLLAGVGRYIASKPDDHPWCNPATWLNQGRSEDQWEDQGGEGGIARSAATRIGGSGSGAIVTMASGRRNGDRRQSSPAARRRLQCSSISDLRH